ncbi:MAG TPA: sugar transferase [Acidimicrobiales bacterium]|nr:sugar transferase [Acidimicrobiales bacterium]
MTASQTAEVAAPGTFVAPGESSSPAPVDREPAPTDGGTGRASVAGFAALAGLVGAGSLAFSFLLLVGPPVRSWSVSPDFRPFLPLLLVAASVRAGLFLLSAGTLKRRTLGCLEEVVDAAKVQAIGTAAIIAFAFYREGGDGDGGELVRSVLFLDWVVATAGLACVAALAKSVMSRRRRQGRDLRRVVVVGTSPSATWFVASVARQPELGYRVVRQLRTGLAPGELEATLVAVVTTTHVDQVLFAEPTVRGDELTRLACLPQLRHVDVGVVPELLGSSPAKARVEAVGDFPVLTLLNEPLPGVRRSIKRTIDVVLASIALVIAGPLMLASAIAIRLRSPGPVLFRQQRIGMDGRPFEMLKFRTMEAGADTRSHERYVTELIRGNGHRPDGALYKLAGDNRVTRLGRFLRRFSIDETPQLLNVLRGDMSVVGPRPPLAYEVAVYEDWHRRRLEAKPGLTGLWQVSGRSRLTFDQMVRLDLRYIESWSPFLDLRIALRTIPAMFRRDAA